MALPRTTVAMRPEHSRASRRQSPENPLLLMALPRTTVAMRPEHWAKLRVMAKTADDRLTADEIESLIHSDEVASLIRSHEAVKFEADLIAKYAPRLKAGVHG